jgi:hypothetical protein
VWHAGGSNQTTGEYRGFQEIMGFFGKVMELTGGTCDCGSFRRALPLRHRSRLHHIGIGRTHARNHILMFIRDLHIRLINATTGELLRELTLDPNRNYQPTDRPPGPPPKAPRTVIHRSIGHRTGTVGR